MESVVKMNTMPLQAGDIDLGTAVKDKVRLPGNSRSAQAQAQASELKTLAAAHPAESADALFWSWAMPR
jgi:hypothetical protein